ncbi:hypothetical protein WR25_02959 [Diploscapter pachys]|uniref:Uncharacterized protein n=1 Tax=Diploscapter pachys TaxID=2018661 RepID=A0A2A2JS73_9BILA|nr:hypothetical protein WR25_02959 [Diploscapter pachys]
MLTIRYGFTKRLSNFHKINKSHIHSVNYKSNNNPFYNQYKHKHKHFNFDNDNNYFFFNHDDYVDNDAHLHEHELSSDVHACWWKLLCSLNYCKTMVNPNSHLPYINSDAMNTAVTAAIGSQVFFMGIVKPPPYAGTSIMYFEYDDGTSFTTWTHWAMNGVII